MSLCCCSITSLLSRWSGVPAWTAWAAQLERSETLEQMRGYLYGPITHTVLIPDDEDVFLL